MFNLLVLISLLASNSYGVLAVTLDASLLTQLGYNNQSQNIDINPNEYGITITDIDQNAFKGYNQLLKFTIQEFRGSNVDLSLFNDSINLENLYFGNDVFSSGNSLTQLTNSKKIVFPFFHYLFIIGCSLTNLDLDVIKGLPNIREFYLQNSNPIQLSPLKPNQLSTWKGLLYLFISTKNQTSLTKEHFNGLDFLIELYFPKSNIKTVEVHTLLALPKVNYVDLSYNEITAFEYLQIPSKLTTLNLEGNKMNYFMLSRTMGYLKYLNLNNNLFRSFKSMDFTFLANLTYLDLSNNPHAYPNEISGHMKPLVNLVKVRLGNLSISTIDSNFFKQNTKLEYIDLSNNKISVLPYNTFSDLKNLIVLDLTNNLISALDSRTFNGLNLKFFIIRNNYLSKIATRTFFNLTTLITLDFSDNLISEIDSSAFNGCYSLRNIWFYGNRLSKLSPRTFENLTLNYLSLNNNQITELDNSTFAGLSSVDFLDINSNSLSKIGPGTFYGINITISLNLNNNLLSELDNDTFVGQNQLTNLGLYNNLFSSFKPGTFNVLPNLQYIFLDGNNLTQLDNSTFAECNNLQHISLYNNPNLPKDNLQSFCPTAAVNCNVYY